MDATKGWTDQETLSLISHLKLHPELWHHLSVHYQNTAKKQSTLKEFSSIFKTSVVEIKRKLLDLRMQYDHELRVARKIGENYEPIWKFYNAMYFLRPLRANYLLEEEKRKKKALENKKNRQTHPLQRENQCVKCDFQKQKAEVSQVKTREMAKRENKNKQYEIYRMNQEWSDDVTLDLIILLKEEESLWKQTHSEYNDRKKRAASLKNISKKLGFGVSSVKSRIHHLKCRFHNERQKELESAGTSKGKQYTSIWKFYRVLRFLNTNGADIDESFLADQYADSELSSSSSSSSTDTETAGPSSKKCKSSTQSPKRKINPCDVELVEDLSVLNRNRDSYQVLGEFVANELRSHSARFAVKLKRKILQSVLEVQEEVLQEI